MRTSKYVAALANLRSISENKVVVTSLTGLRLYCPDQNNLLAFLTLYMGNRASNYVNYMGNAFLLYDWLFSDSTGRSDRQETIRLEALAPDICISCCKQYSPTIGGRIRTRCPACGSSKEHVAYEVQQLSLMLGVNQEYLEWLFLMYFQYKLDRGETWQSFRPDGSKRKEVTETLTTVEIETSEL